MCFMTGVKHFKKVANVEQFHVNYENKCELQGLFDSLLLAN